MTRLVFRLEEVAYVLLDIAQGEYVSTFHLERLRKAASSFYAHLAEAHYIQTVSLETRSNWQLKLNDKMRRLEMDVIHGKVTANQFFRMLNAL